MLLTALPWLQLRGGTLSCACEKAGRSAWDGDTPFEKRCGQPFSGGSKQGVACSDSSADLQVLSAHNDSIATLGAGDKTAGPLGPGSAETLKLQHDFDAN